jgi:itaconate CoA-transferase
VPTNVYPASDGFIYLAIGNNGQWAKLTALSGFEALARPEFATLEQRTLHRTTLYEALGKATVVFTVAQLQASFSAAGLPHSTINTVTQIIEHPAIAPKLALTRVADRSVRLPPSPVDIEQSPSEYSLSPRYGEHTDAVLREAGLARQLDELRAAGVVA